MGRKARRREGESDRDPGHLGQRHERRQAAECKVTLAALLARYNAIVDECETDPSLCIKLTG